MSLEQIVITTIEQASGAELPQEERTLIQDIVSKHEFDEESARMFGEFYITLITQDRISQIRKIQRIDNLCKLVRSQNNSLILWSDNHIYTTTTPPPLEFYPILKEEILIDNLIKYLFKDENLSFNNVELRNVIPILINIIINTKLYDTLENIPLFLKNIKKHYDKDLTLLCIDLLRNLLNVQHNIILPQCNIKQSNNDGLSLEDMIPRVIVDINLSLFPQANSEKEHLETKHLSIIPLVNKFLDKLIEYKYPVRRTNDLNHFEGTFYTILSALTNDDKNVQKIVYKTEFLSRHNPETESLSDVLDKMMSCLLIKIPDYEIIDFLGEGAYKKTYLARDINLEQEVALKIIHIPTLAQQSNVQRIIKIKLENNINENIEEALVKIFQKEAQLMLKATSARSDNISQIYRAYYDKRTEQYIIIEELGDQTLADILAQRSLLSAYTTHDYLKQMINGLEQLYNLGFVHGDLKPENILVNKDGTVRITDFGWSSQIPLLSEHYDDPKYLTNLLTCAPEVFDGKHPDKKSDIWSIGVIAYRMLTGEWPFHHGFTGTEQEWKVLPAEKKQEYIRKIREQMTEEKINEIKNKINEFKLTSTIRQSIYSLTLDPKIRPIENLIYLAQQEGPLLDADDY